MTLKLFLKRFRRGLRLKLKNLIWTEVLVLGDSHALVFRRKSMQKAFDGLFFNVISVGGATLSGLNNPNSKTQARRELVRGLLSSKATLALVQMGEVDAGYLLWHRAERHGKDVSEMLKEAVSNYQDFLIEVKQKMEVVCISAPLPTIPDGAEWGEVAHARREVKTNQRDRTDLTLRLNELMRKFCSDNGIEYLSLDAESMGDDGLVHSRLLNSDPCDHHYEPGMYEELLLAGLGRSTKMQELCKAG